MPNQRASSLSRSVTYVLLGVVIIAISCVVSLHRTKKEIATGPYFPPAELLREQASQFSGEEIYWLSQPGNESLLAEYKRIRRTSGERGIQLRTALKVRLQNR